MHRRDAYGWGIAVVGLALASVQFVQGIQQLQELTGVSQSDQAIVFTFETFPFTLIALSLVYVGYWLRTQPQFDPDHERILSWAVGSTVLFASIAALILFSQQVTLDTLEQGEFLAMNLITVGVVTGVLLGIYDARGRARERELERERDRIEAFAGKAADINNYGRALNRAQSVDEVSALCIEGLQTLLGLTSSGFVAIDGDQSTVVNSTIVGVETEVLVELAQEAGEQEQASVVIKESVPEELDAKRLLSVLVTTHDDASVVLLAPVSAGATFDDEDLRLLELLISHAGTALDQIHEKQTAVESVSD